MGLRDYFNPSTRHEEFNISPFSFSYHHHFHPSLDHHTTFLSHYGIYKEMQPPALSSRKSPP